MKKNTRYYKVVFLGLIFILGLSSCEEFFIQELEIPRQNLDQQMVVHAFISDIDTAIEFKIANNFGLDNLVEEPKSLIDGATVGIYRSGELLHQIGQDTAGKYKIDLPGIFGNTGQNFRVEIDHPDYEKAHVETQMPSFVEPESITFEKDGGFAQPGGEDNLDLIQITFTDPAEEDNYYEFQVHQIQVSYDELIIGQDTFISETRYPDNYFTPDGNFEPGISGFLLSDDLINGQQYTIQIMLVTDFPVDEIPVDKLRVSWNCISREQYEYSKSLQQFQTSSNFGLFSDPVAVLSNVENGLGFVAFRSQRVYPVEER
jgi:hypothetical protein